MSITLFGQAALNGLLFGGVYSLMAVGLSLIFGVMRVINIAHGDMMVWGSFLAYVLAIRVGLDPFFSFALCAAALFCLGVLVQRGLVNRVLAAPHEMQILLTLGVALVLENLALVIFGPDTRRTESMYGLATLWLGPMFVDVPRLITFFISLAFSLALYVFLFRTHTGKLIRAAADNSYGALVIGADVERIYTVAFGIGAACVGAAGALMSALLPFSPAAGFPQTVTSFNIVIIGGMGSLLGAFLGGILVAVAESLGAVLLVPSLKELVSFVLLVLILLFRPQGLFGGKAN
jgi:branched-chain amino acid transport system permease protein